MILGKSSNFHDYYDTYKYYNLAQAIAHFVSSTLAIVGMLNAARLR